MAKETLAYDTPCVLFITHAEVAIDPALPVPEWPLSLSGRARHLAFNDREFIQDITAIYCSAERKAIDGAEILAGATGLKANIREALGENDRSSTGFLPPPEFQKTADLFFAHPEQSIRGWERAIDAQTRVVEAVNQILAEDASTGHIAIVSHGGVGTLLLCHLTGSAISRAMDQPGSGGGNSFAFDRATRSVLYGWRDIGSR
ncbi:histidine phosphatase family protein [Pleomorphomonas oryzae]|uniref:histidine phosphatase family protein n=1 Tax=Pleomorphomonas oryzae TaxID=261934 RepID=UPI00040CCF73|nr:histidine phosphatase family protein [Pleomorphomonas oryzae]